MLKKKNQPFVLQPGRPPALAKMILTLKCKNKKTLTSMNTSMINCHGDSHKQWYISVHTVGNTHKFLTCDTVSASRACSLCNTLDMSCCSLSRAVAICSLMFSLATLTGYLLCDTQQQTASTLAERWESQGVPGNGEPGTGVKKRYLNACEWALNLMVSYALTF